MCVLLQVALWCIHSLTRGLVQCNELLYVEVHAVKDGGEALFEWISKRSTFVPDEVRLRPRERDTVPASECRS